MTHPPALPSTSSQFSNPAAASDVDLETESKAASRRFQSMPGWLVSSLVHALAFVVIGSLTIPATNPVKRLFLSIPFSDEKLSPIVPQDFEVSDLAVDEIGALSDGSAAFEAAALAPEVVLLPEVAAPGFDAHVSINPLEPASAIEIATGADFSKTFAVKGLAGVGMRGADGAIDRLTHEILVSMEERPTLVAWLFDQSGSLNRQRREFTKRFDAIYDQIGDVQATGIFSKFEDEPLLSTVIAFGSGVTFRTKKPIADPSKLSAAVAAIEEDKSGIERVFEAIGRVVDRYHGYRSKRNILVIVVSDEAGDDQKMLDETVTACQRYAIPVYVVGVPAPFGQVETMVKWVDPNPNFNQEPQWGRVNQGPESLLPERIQLAFTDAGPYEPPLDSGFGPYALTRLCYQTGGIYFTVHPNRRTDRLVRARETSASSAHFHQFFSEDAMRRYRPDYVSAKEYDRRVKSRICRQSLVSAAQQSWIDPLQNPRRRFPATNEAEFVQNLTDGQKAAAKLEPQLERLFAVLEQGEQDRNAETEPRWQAGFDLAIGRTLAALVRTKAYNAILAEAKRGLKTADPDTNLWILRSSNQIQGGSELKRMGDKAGDYLSDVVDNHPGTPWAALAERDLEIPLGWDWIESHFNPRPRRRMVNSQNRLPRDDQRRMLERPKPKREVPKL